MDDREYAADEYPQPGDRVAYQGKEALVLRISNFNSDRWIVYDDGGLACITPNMLNLISQPKNLTHISHS